MILGFKTHINGERINFVMKILVSVIRCDISEVITPKLHTIRAGNRWKAGMKMHMWIQSHQI